MLLTYWTVPYVKLNDIKIRGMYTAGVVSVIIYMFTSIIWDQGYLEQDNVRGFARTHMKQKLGNPPGPYCDQLACEDHNSEETVFEFGTDEVFVTTLVREIPQETTCTGAQCAPFHEAGNISRYFVQGVDHMTMKLKHNMFCNEFSKTCDHDHPDHCPFAARELNMAGAIIGHDGKVFETLAAGVMPKISVEKWLRAAGMSLDDHSDMALEENGEYRMSKHGDAQLPTNRFRGFVLLVDISYMTESGTFMDFLFSQPRLRYEVRLRKVPLSEYKKKDATSEETFPGGKRRTLIRRHGFLMRVVQSGQCSRFSRSKMLEKFLVNTALIGLLTTIIELVWQFIFPLFGLDYNVQVYKEVQEFHKPISTSNKEGEKTD